MKYLTKQTADSFLVRLSGPEEEQAETAILAENIFNTNTKDTYAGKIIAFKNERQFRNFLFWQNIFALCSPNSKFNFKSLTRPAAKKTREAINNSTFCLDSIEE